MIIGRYGVDTVRASEVLVEPLSERFFPRRFKIGKIEKWATRAEGHEPACAYYPEDRRLIFEVSLPYFASGQNVEPVDAAAALVKVNKWLLAKFDRKMPHVGLWSTSRIDYFTTFQVGDDLPDYLAVLKNRELPRYERVEYQRGGVVWRAKSRHINCYDKWLECGQGRGELRFEVCNRKSAINYFARRWLGLSGRPLYSLISRESSYKVVAHFLNALDVFELEAAREGIADFKEVFPRSWAQAMTYRDLIARRGSDAWRDGTVPRSTFYRYRKALREAGLLDIPNCERLLEPLRLMAPAA